VDLLASLATLSTVSSSSSALDGTTAGIALASVVHKCCAYNANQRTQQQGRSSSSASAGVVAVDALIAVALPRLLECLQQPAAQQQQQALGAVHAASWLSRGLALQRHDGWQQCMQAVLQLLLHDTAVTATDRHAAAAVHARHQQLLWAAAEYFTVLIASPAASSAAVNRSLSANSSSSGNSSSGAAKLGLQLSLHCCLRPLWQQKAFILALQALADAISSHQQAAAAAAAETQPQEQQQQGLGLWLAVACLLSSAPPAVAAAARETAVPLLLQCLVRLIDAWPVLAGSSSSNGLTAAAGSAVVGQPSGAVRLLQLLHSSLLMVADLLVTASQSTDLLEAHISTLLDVLCELARLLPVGSSKQVSSSSTPAVMNMAGCGLTAAAAAAGGGGGGEGSSKERAEVAAGAAAVREVALMCLTSVMGLPYHLLHPYR
jgi:hypothetical protein